MTGEELAVARERAEAGESARSIARDLGVAASSITRAAQRLGWRVPWGQRPTSGPPASLSANPALPGRDHTGPPLPEPQIEAERPAFGPRGPIPAPRDPNAPEPPESEAAARLWVCPRCRQVGYDPNLRERAWHTPELCDERMARLDRVLDDRGRAIDVMTVRW